MYFTTLRCSLQVYLYFPPPVKNQSHSQDRNSIFIEKIKEPQVSYEDSIMITFSNEVTTIS